MREVEREGNGSRGFGILMIEDSPIHTELQRIVFESTGQVAWIRSHEMAETALDDLHGRGKFADRERYPLPDLITVDLRLPRAEGDTFIESIRNNESLAHLPCVVLSTSNASFDQEKAERAGADAYIAKPLRLEHAIRLCNGIEQGSLQRELNGDLPGVETFTVENGSLTDH